MFDRLDRITRRAESHPEEALNNVFSLLTFELLAEAFRKLKRDKAPGVDGVTVATAVCRPAPPPAPSRRNIAENELSSLTRQCVAGQRFPDATTLREETQAWSTDVNVAKRGVDWQMRIDDARTKLKSVDPTMKL